MSRTLWFAGHELRLAWREFMSMLTAGRPSRQRTVVAVIIVFAALLHLFAWKMIAPYADVTFPPAKETLIAVTGSAFLAWTVMMSQAMESVTRAFYSRADLDLLMSSPAPMRSVFALRIASVGVATSLLALILVAPFINILALYGGWRWLSAYVVLFAMASAATALAVGMTVLMFQLFGPKRTRFIAQVAAAVVGAVFVIGIQAVSIFTYGNLSRMDAFHSAWMMRMAPEAESWLWIPARAVMGDLSSVLLVVFVGFGLFVVAVSVASRRFGHYALAAASTDMGSGRAGRARRFRQFSAAAALRHKEWALLLRDPWLASQTLMQILYLIPPALLLWRNYGGEESGLFILVPVLVMASGQLAGGLAWLAISGEDAPDLVRTAPIGGRAILRAKVEAVIGAVAFVVAPIVAALVFASPWIALVTAMGVLVASASSTAIQMFFRAQARRSQFRRRQTSSRLATFAEAFTSIGWAGTAGLAVIGSEFALLAAIVPVSVIMLTWMFGPKQLAA